MKSSSPEVLRTISIHRSTVVNTQSGFDARFDNVFELEKLAREGYSDAVEALHSSLTELKNERDSRIRIEIVDALGSIKQISAFAGLFTALEDKDPAVSQKALLKVAYLATDLNEQDKEFQQFAKKEALRMIDIAKNDARPEVRQFAYSALQHITERNR